MADIWSEGCECWLFGRIHRFTHWCKKNVLLIYPRVILRKYFLLSKQMTTTFVDQFTITNILSKKSASLFSVCIDIFGLFTLIYAHHNFAHYEFNIIHDKRTQMSKIELSFLTSITSRVRWSHRCGHSSPYAILQ